jgi:sugar lactone lactonase YvrE
VDSAGTVYVVDQGNQCIRKITPAGVVTTFAGSSAGSADGTGTNASFTNPFGVAVDSVGNVYVTDGTNHRIRKITPEGVVTTLAGSLSNTSGSTDGTGTNASFSNPQGVAVDSAGNVYVGEYNNYRIRKITPAGVVTTFAGSLSNTPGSANGTGTNATFSTPTGLAVDSAGNVYVADQGNQRIRRITSTGVVTTLAGSSQGSTDGTGTNATFSAPTGVAVDSAGNVYVADQTNNRIRRIIAKTYSLLPYTTQTGSSAITVPASTTQTLNFAVPSSSLPSTLTLAGTWVLKLYAFLVSSTSSATITCQVFNGTTLLTSGTSSVIVSSMTVQLYPITFIIPTVNIPDYLELDVIVTTQSSPLTFQFTAPNLSLMETSFPSVTLKPSSGSVIQLDSGFGTVDLPQGIVSTFAGSSQGSTDATGTNATFNSPREIAIDSLGNLYVVDTNNHRIRRITPEGVVTTFAGSSSGSTDGIGTNATFNGPTGIVVDSVGNLYVVDQSNHRIRRITQAGVVTTFAGSLSNSTGSTDGVGTNASFNFPSDIAFDSSGNMYVTDQSNNSIRRITPSGVVTTFAGSLLNSSGSTDGIGTNARFNTPHGIAVDSVGNVYVADRGNHRIRIITPAGVVTTFAGSSSGSADGTGTNASFNNPFGISVDSLGNVYVADRDNSRIRKITSAGVVSTFAGSSRGYLDATGTNAQFNLPQGIAVDSTGNLYVGDSANHRIRRIIAKTYSLLPYTTQTGSSAITVPASTTQTLNFGIPASSLPSTLSLGGTWMLTLYAVLTTSTSSATITCQVYNGTTLLTSGTTSVTVASMTVQPYSIPFIVPTVNIPDYLELDVIVTTQSSPLTFQFTAPNLSFLQTSLPITTLKPSSGLTLPLASGTVNFPFVTTFAGSLSNTFGSTDGIGTNASFRNPTGVAFDLAGTMYVADALNNRIRKIDTGGVVTTFVGSTSGSTDGTGTNATFSVPYGITVDSAGTVYVTETANSRIRKITPAGVVTTLAGNLSNLTGNTDGTGTNARFFNPTGLALDSTGNIFIADQGNHRIRRITQAGVVTTFAGSTQGSADGTGTNASFWSPAGVAFDSVGNLYVADRGNNRIRRITSAGVVTTFAGSLSNTIGSTDGTGTNASFNLPFGVAVDSAGNVYVADQVNNRIRRITSAGVVTTIVGSSSGSADGIATNVGFNVPTGLAVDSTGTVFVADEYNHRIRKLTNIENSLLSYTPSSGSSAITVSASTTRTVSFGIPASSLPSSLNIAGTWALNLYAFLTTSTSSATITCQLFNGTTLLTSGTTGVTVASMTVQPYSIPFIVPNVNIVDYLRLNVIVTTQSSPITFQFTAPNLSFLQTSLPITTLTPSSGLAFPLGSGNTNLPVVSTFAGNGSTVFANGSLIGSTFNLPVGIALDSSGSMYIADTNNHRIRKITAGVVTTFAGNGLTTPFADGTGTNSSFHFPCGVAVDLSGNVFVADTDNHRIRRITPAGVVSTFAGNGTSAFQDGNGTNARFSSPQSVAIDSSGNLYVGEFSNHRIRKISPTADVTTLAGSTQGYLDATGTNARFYNPCGVAVDSSSNVYVADQANHRIRRITPSGVVTTLAGNTSGFANGLGTNANFHNPYGITVDPLGNVFVSDLANQRIRRITPTGVVTTAAGAIQSFNDGNGIFANFNNPRHLLIDPTGIMYVVDQANHRIRRLAGLNVENSLLPFTSTGTSAVTVPASTTQTLNFGVPASFLSSFSLAGTWMLTLYASLTTSTSPATITCQLYNGTTLLTSGTTSVTVSSMTSQSYSIPFVVPNVYISEFLELDVIVTTQSSPVTFHFSSPNMSFLQTSFPLTSQYGNPSVNGTDYAYHQRSTHMFFGQGVVNTAGTIGVYSTESNVIGQGGSIGLGARSYDFGGGQQHQIQARIAGVVEGNYVGAFTVQTCSNGALPERLRVTNSDVQFRNPNTGHIFRIEGPDSGYTVYLKNGNGGVYLGNGATSWVANSDSRLKTIIAPVSNALAGIETITPVYYKFKTDGPEVTKNRIGVIAQEVLQVFPEVVSQTIDGMYGVSYSDMVVPLIGAVKELSARLALLESQFAASQTPQ